MEIMEQDKCAPVSVSMQCYSQQLEARNPVWPSAPFPLLGWLWLWTRSQGSTGPYQVILLGDLEQQGAASAVVGQDEVDLLQRPQLDDTE